MAVVRSGFQPRKSQFDGFQVKSPYWVTEVTANFRLEYLNYMLIIADSPEAAPLDRGCPVSHTATYFRKATQFIQFADKAADPS